MNIKVKTSNFQLFKNQKWFKEEMNVREFRENEIYCQANCANKQMKTSL